MFMKIIAFALLVLFVCVMVFVYLRRSKSAQSENRKRELTHNHHPVHNPTSPAAHSPASPAHSTKPNIKQYWAKYLDYPETAVACKAAMTIRKQHITEIGMLPVIPLTDCTMTNDCRCFLLEVREKRRGQRRVNRERRDDFRFETGKPAKTDRRVLHGRRKGDVSWESGV
jgi:hypothetical protein